jgi:hypothetical protein
MDMEQLNSFSALHYDFNVFHAYNIDVQIWKGARALYVLYIIEFNFFFKNLLMITAAKRTADAGNPLTADITFRVLYEIV